MTTKTLAVFTYRHKEEIIGEGGSQAWKIKPDSVRRCTYLVCTRNRHHDGAGPEVHGSAFLVGRISRVEVSPERDDRFIVRFSEYAEVSVPNVWTGGRNPIWYVDDIASLNIDVEKLDWKPVKGVEVDYDLEADDDGLSFEDARAGLARRYGFPPDAIEISIRG